MTRQQAWLLSILLAPIVVPELSWAQSGIPDAVNALVGEYQGEWTSYGIDESGKVTKKMSWTDVLVAKDPIVENGKAYVTFTNVMTARGAQRPFMTVAGKEGFELQDGKVANYFIETFGQTYTAKRLSDTTWAYLMPSHPQELVAYGFSNVVSGQHVMVKVQTEEDGVDTHRISRVTTVHWKDTDGAARWIQFTSLQGMHRRVTPATR